MGNAMTAVSGEGIYAAYNPALAADVTSAQLNLGTAVMGFGRSLNQVNASFRMPPNAGISISLANANVSGIDGRTSSGYHTSKLSTHDYQLITSFAIKPGSKLQLGAGLKLNFSDYHDDVDATTAFGMDFGLIVTPSERFRIAAAVQDLFAEASWNTGKMYRASGAVKTTDTWPTRISIGSAYRITESWLLSADMEHRIHTSAIQKKAIELGFENPIVFNREEQLTTTSQLLRVGTRYHIHERLTLRAGYQNNDLKRAADNQRLSAGFSVHLPFDRFSPSVDYAITREPNGISFMHAFAIRLNL